MAAVGGKMPVNALWEEDHSSLRVLADAPSEILDAIPTGICIVDARGRLVRLNVRAREIWGRSPRMGELTERLFAACTTYSADGSRLSFPETPLAEVLRTGKAIRDREIEIERLDGERRVLLATVEPLWDSEGSLVGAIDCFQDITDRSRSERELKRSQQDLEDFFENGAVGLHLVGSDGTILRANEAELSMLGYSAEEYIGHSIRDFHADEHVIADILGRLVSGERLDKYPARLKAKDGSIRHVLITSNVHFQNGQFLNTRCFTVDVTNWRSAEIARNATERRLATTVEAAPVGIIETDANGCVLRANPAYCELVGYSPDELSHMTFVEITHPEDREEDWRLYRQQRDGMLDTYVIEKRYVRKDGHEIFVQVRSSTVRDAEGRFEHGVRIVEDISFRRQAEERLAESERHWRELLNGLPIAIYTTDAEGRVTFFNDAAVEFAGRTPQIGSDSWCATWRLYELDGTPLPHADCPMAVSLKEGREVRGAVALAERPDGTRVPFMPFPKLLRGPSGEIVQGINMLVDLSERFRAEEEQRTLIDELNHRVKNTLATVQSLAAQTMRSTPASFQENFEARLMALSRAHGLLTRRNWAGVSIVELLDEQFKPYRGNDERIDFVGTEVVLKPRAGLQFGMLIHELTTNALKYGALSRPAGKVSLRWWSIPTDVGKQRLRMEWRERGGPPVSAPAKRGFGTKLIERSVTRDLDGNIDIRFAPAGLECDIDFPLE